MGNLNGMVINKSSYPVWYMIYGKFQKQQTIKKNIQINPKIKLSLESIEVEGFSYSKSGQIIPEYIESQIRVLPKKAVKSGLSQLKAQNHIISVVAKVYDSFVVLKKNVIVRDQKDINILIDKDLSVCNLTNQEAQKIFNRLTKKQMEVQSQEQSPQIQISNNQIKNIKKQDNNDLAEIKKQNISQQALFGILNWNKILNTPKKRFFFENKEEQSMLSIIEDNIIQVVSQNLGKNQERKYIQVKLLPIKFDQQIKIKIIQMRGDGYLGIKLQQPGDPLTAILHKGNLFGVKLPFGHLYNYFPPLKKSDIFSLKIKKNIRAMTRTSSLIIKIYKSQGKQQEIFSKSQDLSWRQIFKVSSIMTSIGLKMKGDKIQIIDY